jgi:hypothetical protein
MEGGAVLVPLTPENAWLLGQQSSYSAAQKAFAIGSPHLMYVRAKRTQISRAMRRAVFERDEGMCRHCGRPLRFNSFHVDHLVPIARGGGNEMQNLAASCAPCNLSKGAG